MRRVLLAGATGHLGRHALRLLGERGHWVRALVRTPQQGADLRGFVQDTAVGDLVVRQSLSECCKGIDTVISCAGASVHIKRRGRQSFREIDYQGNTNLLREAKNAGVGKFIYVSVLATPELMKTEYVRAKEELAALVAQSGLDYQIVRPAGFFSAFADLVSMAARGPLPLMGSGEARTNPIDDEEVARACVEAVDSKEKEVSIGGPDILTRREAFSLAFTAQGLPPRFRAVSPALVRAAIPAVGLFHRRMRDLTEFYLSVSLHDAIAPVYGARRLEDYFSSVARVRPS